MEIPNLSELKICRNLCGDAIFNRLNAESRKDTGALAAALIERAETLGLSGNLIRSYAAYLMAEGNHIVASTVESAGQIGESLTRAFLEDMEILRQWLALAPSAFLPTRLLDDYRPTTANPSAAFASLQKNLETVPDAAGLADIFLRHYQTYGSGDIANFPAFRWDAERRLVGVRHFEPMTLDDLIGYDRQKETLAANTEAFVSGKPANNVLLVGARGTGKSTAVKALANRYFDRGLRLVETHKSQMAHLPKIMETLRRVRSKKFILFLDDLSFEEFEVEYKCLKSAIEGGVEAKPPNVLIYATSNRRHLIKETFKDRGEISDELHRNDHVNETISLSDRFGLTIHYLAPTQDEYLKIIDELLKKEGVALPKEELRLRALRWEMTHSGRSGRTARQFVTHYLSGGA